MEMYARERVEVGWELDWDDEIWVVTKIHSRSVKMSPEPGAKDSDEIKGVEYGTRFEMEPKVGKEVWQ